MIEEYLFQQASHEPRTGRDLHAQATYGPARSLRVRVQLSERLVRGPDGDLVATDAVGWVEPSAALRLDDRLTVDGQRYRVALVRVGQALTEAEFLKFYLARL